MRARELLTPEERLRGMEIPDDIDERELAVYFTLTFFDIEVIQRHTVYLTKAIGYLKSKKSINEELLCHVSPLAWEHINFIGDYSFNLKEITTLDFLKPLNIV